MKTFAYITTPINTEQLKGEWQSLKLVPDFVLRPFRKTLPEFKLINLGKFESSLSQPVKGQKIVCPILDEYKQQHLVLEKIISACKLAEESNVSLIGLDGYAAFIACSNYAKISKAIKVPVTCGNALSAWYLFEKVFRLAKAKNIDLRSSSALCLGIDMQSGSLAARKLSEYVSKMTISGVNKEALGKLKQTISDESRIDVTVSLDPEAAIREAGIIINPEEVYKIPEELKENRIYSGIEDLRVKQYGSSQLIPVSLAETALLLLNSSSVGYTLGGNTNLDSLEEIADIATRHGYELWLPEAPVL